MPRHSGHARRGFALVITLALMVLLTLLVTGLLSLSSISLRASAQGQAMAVARANARLALLLAIGELQRQTGPDTRITARADILAQNNPPVLGVWKSWQGDDHETTGAFAGRPVSPGDYASAKKKKFVAWLTSANTQDPTTLPDTTPGTGKVTVVGSGSLGSGAGRDKLQIHLAPTPVTTQSQMGGLAWWIGGENQKARLPQPYKPTSSTAGRWAVQAKSYPIADPLPFRLEPVLQDPTVADKAISLNQADLLASDKSNKTSREFFHDLSAVSVGLLTNSATGGWRKDLSLLTENWSAQPTSGLPLFQLTAGTPVAFTRPTTANPVPAAAMLYPWATYRGSSVPTYLSATVSSWENLADYATLYKKMSASSGRLSIPVHAFSTWTYKPARPDVFYHYLHEVRILPRIARMQWVFSHTASSTDSNGNALPVGKLEPRLLVTPVITMWNPYNVEIASPPLQFIIGSPLPVALSYSIDGVPVSGVANTYNSLMAGDLVNYPNAPLGALSLDYQIKNGFTLKPGETRIFSPAANNQMPSNRALLPGNIIQNTVVPIELIAGVHNGGGDIFPIKGSTGNTLASASNSTIKADVKLDNTFNWRGSPQVPNPQAGFAFNMTLYDVVTNYSTYPDGLQVTWYQMLYPPATANAIYPPAQGLASTSLGQCQGQPMPFLSTVFGARMASRTNLPSKGFVQSSLFANYSAMGADNITYGYHYPGTNHPVNSPYDYSFIKHPSGGDNQLPNASDTTDRGYIVTGFNSSDGLSRCVIDELPTRPLVSLGELTHWDLRFENAFPPYAFNLIGNSDASPLFPANAVVNDNEKGKSTNPQHDDSYCANHLLFDDWFVSSIAPAPAAFGQGGSIQQTYTDFVKDTTPLGNRVYQPIPADRAAAASNATAATQLYTDHVAKTDSWKSIASRLEVTGMFNVNSTSVTAWRALLGHCRKQCIPYVSESATSWDAVLSAETDYALSRFSVAGDTKAGQTGSSGDFPDATEFTGYRTIDGKFLDSLAAEVVNQVRLRGPFLSLAEFVNRQLSSGNLALAGALQSALNEVAKTNNLFAAIQANSKSTNPNPPSVLGNAPEYQFPDAAAGYSTYGLPGWTRQADILRPLAPILSVRDDTFTIRGYGDARDAKGQIIAHVICEAVVRRTRDFSDPADAADIFTAPTAAANKTFGRHFQLVSFRWLAADEV